MRVDKDSVSDLGTVWDYKNSDGTPCCPSSARPTIANKAFQIGQSSNCLDGGCYDPDSDTSDVCTLENQCAGSTLLSVTTPTGGLSVQLNTAESTSSLLDGVYIGFNIIFSSPLLGLGTNTGVTNSAGTTCGPPLATYQLVFTVPTGQSGRGATATVAVDNSGNIPANSVNVLNVGQGYTIAPTVTCSSCPATCTASFQAILGAPLLAGTSKTIVGYQAATRTAYLDSAHASLGGFAATSVFYRISADTVSR